MFTDSGTYICESFNNIGNSSALLQILVQSKCINKIYVALIDSNLTRLFFVSLSVEPFINSIYSFSSDIITHEFMYTIPLNYTGSALVCTANGWPAPEVEWQKDGQRLPSSYSIVSEASAMVSTVSARLTWIRKFVSSDAGSYQCIVRKPNTVVPVTLQVVQVIAGAVVPPGTLPPCSIKEQLVFFQIRVFATECTTWGTWLSSKIASEFRNQLVSIIKTECTCLVSKSVLELLGSPQCSNKVTGAAVFRGKIETSSQSETEELFCALFSWQQRSPLIQINDQLRVVDDSCSLEASSSHDSAICSGCKLISF